MVHGDDAAASVAVITELALTPEQVAAEGKLLAEQEQRQAQLLLDQYKEKKGKEAQFIAEEDSARENIQDQLEKQKSKVFFSLFYTRNFSKWKFENILFVYPSVHSKKKIFFNCH